MGNFTHAVAQKFLCAMKTAPIAPRLSLSSRILVGYSGGADSAALLILMQEFCAERGIALLALHVHHGIRGEEADADAAFARSFCAERGIPYAEIRVDVPAYADRMGVGLEEAARALRYEALKEEAERVPGTCIATAHSADDHLETVLFRMVRGTALSGLLGIPAAREGIVRPLLACTAKEIRDFCRAKEIPYVTDSTNGDIRYTRNYIREEVVPKLSIIQQNPAAAVYRMSQALQADADYLNEATLAALGDYQDKTAAPAGLLAGLPDALLNRALLRLYDNASHTKKDLTSVHLADMAHLVKRGGYGRLSLPGGRMARLFCGTFSIVRKEDSAVPAEEFSAELPLGESLFPSYGFGVRLEKGCHSDETAEKCENIYKLSIRRSIPFATIKGTVRMRFRKPGDRIRLRGMHRRVKKLLNEKKVPPEERDTLPVFLDDDGIFYIPGLPPRDGEPAGGETLFITYFVL